MQAPLEDTAPHARYRREAEFHDQVFAESTRAGTRRFYEAGARAYEYYGDRLRQLGGPSDTVLEYGCGPGTRAFELADRGAVVHGIDISPVAIELARSEANRRGVSDRTTFSVMNAEALEFTPGTFDLVCGTSIIHHLDVSRALEQVAAVLKPGGAGLFLEPLGHNPLINLYRRLTPDLRTADEHPLHLSELREVGRWFHEVDVHYFSLTTLLSTVAVGRPAFRGVRAALERLDEMLLRDASPLQPWAWTVVIELGGRGGTPRA